MSLTLITSAAYVDSELSAEFGQLPPAFLPIGHRRLYEAQMSILSQFGGHIVLTLPESFEVPEADKQALDKLDVTTLHIPDGMSLGSSVLFALEILAVGEKPVRVLHGDTLMNHSLPTELDVVTVSSQPEIYDWGVIDQNINKKKMAGHSEPEVLAGYFAFGSETELRRSLARGRGDFLTALRLYDSVLPLTRVHIDDWLDFGHLQTYYRSRCSIQTEREFNELRLSFQSVKKSGSNSQKIAAEAYWYKNIPDSLRLFTPAFLGEDQDDSGRVEYKLEYLPLPTLHELFVFGDLSEGAWRLIIDNCNTFLMQCRDVPVTTTLPIHSNLPSLIREKTAQRLDLFCKTSNVSADEEWRFDGQKVPSLRNITKIANSAIDFETNRFHSIMHGDLCFTNIFFDFRTQRIRVIDPRGSLDGINPTIWGDCRYDIAKLCHSIIGGYDLILAGRYSCDGLMSRDTSFQFSPTPSRDTLLSLSQEVGFLDYRLNDPEILAICIHLFLSMLPLHSDSPRRQEAFIINTLRLFTELEKQL